MPSTNQPSTQHGTRLASLSVSVCVCVCVCVCVRVRYLVYHLVIVERLERSIEPHSYVAWSLVLLVKVTLGKQVCGRQSIAQQLVGWDISECESKASSP